MTRNVDPVYLGAFLLGLSSAIYWLPGLNYVLIDNIKYSLLAGFLILLAPGVSVRRSPLNNSIFISIGLLLTPVMFHGFQGSTEWRIGVVYLLIPLIFFMLVNHSRCDAIVRYFGRGFLISGVLLSAYIVVSFSFSLNLAPVEIVGKRIDLPYNPMGFSYSYTIASPTIAAALLLSIFGKEFYPLIVRLAFLPPLMCGLILSTGEGGMLGFAVGVCSVFLGTRGRLLGVLAGLSLFVAILLFRDDLIGGGLGQYSMTATERLASLMSGLETAMRFPLMGAGPGQSGNYFAEFMFASKYFDMVLSETLQPHASAILLAAELGLFGTIYSLQLYRWVGLGIVRAKVRDSEKLFVSTLICFTFLSLIEPWPLVSNLFLTIWPLMVLASCVKPRRPRTFERPKSQHAR